MLSATTILMLSYLCLSMAGMQVTMRVHMDITLAWDLIQVRKVSVMVLTFTCVCFIISSYRDHIYHYPVTLGNPQEMD